MMKRITNLLLLFWTLSVSLSAHSDWEPKADDAAIVTSGNMRFTVLTPQMIRIQYSASQQFEDRSTFAVVNRKLEVPSFTSESLGGYLYIRTSQLELRYLLGSTPRESDCNPKNLQITFQLNGQTVVWYPGKDDTMNLLGTTRTLDRAWGDAQRGQLEKGLLSRAGWALIDESPKTRRGDGSTTFAMEDSEDGFPWWKEPVDKQAIDWYFLGYGHDYKQALGDFTKIAGKVPMPPKYIFGYWYSRYWGYTQLEFQNIVSQAEANDVPMDVIIVDMDWHKPGWTGWSWNTNLIPNPTYLLQYFHKHGLKTALNLHPADGVASYEDGYPQMSKDLGYADGQTIPWKIDDYDFYKSFFKNIMRLRESEGVDFWWLDWQQWLTSPYTEGLSETFWINHVFYTDMEKYRTDVRPVIYHRWGGLGSHRYPICFSGDTYASWSTLAYEIPFTSMASNVCYTYWGHDLGGHQGGDNDPELLQRWLQFGVFTPIFRTHATNDSKLERRIWKYKNFSQLRETVRLRYRLFPYLYTAARETYDTGVGMNRPLYYEWPETDNAYRFEDEYLFGRDILVAPIYTPSVEGVSTRKIWLPEGLWWDVTHRQLMQGDRTLTDRFTTDEFPYYYRAGSVIPQYPVQRTVQQTPDTLVLQVVPGANGEGRFYEDHGDNQDYSQSAYANTWFRQTYEEGHVTLQIEPRQGSFEGMPMERVWRVEMLGQQVAPQQVVLDGETLPEDRYAYDSDKALLTVVVAKGACDKGHRLEVMSSQGTEIVQEGQKPSYNENVANEASPVSGQLYVTGSAVPEGMAMLEYYSDGTFKFHGHLQEGELFIVNKDKITATTKYCKPRLEDVSILSGGVGYSQAYGNSNAAWKVPFESDHYRFSVNPSTMMVTGELFTPWYECWIVGGCTGPGQTSGWDLAQGKQMMPDSADPDEWVWTGRLGVYPANDQGNRMKISGQYGWEPKRLCPYVQDSPLLGAKQVIYNSPTDYKWTISESGYYTVRVNPFRETISAVYHGATLPVGIEETPAEPAYDDAIFDIMGRKVDRPTRGLYIRHGRKFVR